jgi:hypothetical protein
MLRKAMRKQKKKRKEKKRKKKIGKNKKLKLPSLEDKSKIKEGERLSSL